MSGKRVLGNAGRPARLGPASKRLSNPRTLPAKSQLKASTSTGILHHASSSPSSFSRAQPNQASRPAQTVLGAKRPASPSLSAKKIDVHLIQRAKVNLAKRADQFRKAKLAAAQLKAASLVQKAPLNQQVVAAKQQKKQQSPVKTTLSLKDKIASWFVRLVEGDDETAPAATEDAAAALTDSAATEDLATSSDMCNTDKDFSVGGWYSVSRPAAGAVFGSLLAVAAVIVVFAVIVAALVKLGQRGAFGASNTPAFVFAAALLALALFPSGQLSAFVMSCLALHHLRTPGSNFLGLA